MAALIAMKWLATTVSVGSDASEADVVAAFAGFWSYQLAGLAGFKEWVLA